MQSPELEAPHNKHSRLNTSGVNYQYQIQRTDPKT